MQAREYNNVQDDLLARIIVGEFVCGKLIGKFYIGDFVAHAIEHLQIETNGRFYIDNSA